MSVYSSNTSVGLLVAAGGIALATCYVILSSSKSENIHCVLKCKCGKVSADITAPQSTPSAAASVH